MVGRDRVIAGVDCGFGTMIGLEGVDTNVAWAKLRSLVEGAELDAAGHAAGAVDQGAQELAAAQEVVAAGLGGEPVLQDVEAGRSLEVEALMGAVLEIGRMTGTPAPAIEAVYACVKLLNRTMLLQGAGVRVGAAA